MICSMRMTFPAMSLPTMASNITLIRPNPPKPRAPAAALLILRPDASDPNHQEQNTLINHIYKDDPHLTKIVDQSGNTIYVTAISGGTLLKVVSADVPDADAVYLRLQQDSSNRVTAIYTDVDPAVVDSGTLMVQYTYDSLGNLQTVSRKTSASPEAWTNSDFAYDNRDSVVAHSLTILYTPHASTATTSPTALITNVYDLTTGRLSSTTDADGHTITYNTAQTINHQETVTDRSGVSTEYDYDDDGNVIRTTNLATNQITVDVYQPGTASNARFETTAYGTPLAFTKYFTYDDAGNQTSVTYTVDGKTTVTHSSYIQILSQQLLASSTDAFGTVTTNLYNDQAQLSETDVTDPAGNLLQLTKYSNYNSSNPGLVTQYIKNAAGQWVPYVTTETLYNTFGFVTETRTLAGDGTFASDGVNCRLARSSTVPPLMSIPTAIFSRQFSGIPSPLPMPLLPTRTPSMA